jgi:hypothetical protein
MDFEEHRMIDLQSSFFEEVLASIGHSYQSNWGIAVATMSRTREFFQELTRRAVRNSWLSLWSLRLNGRLVALEYQLRSHGQVHALWSGDAPAYRTFQPRNALQMLILRRLFGKGCIYEYSLGPDLQTDHPWWATSHHETVHLKLYQPNFYARLLCRLETGGVQGALK